MFQRERHRFPIDIFPKFTYDETGDVGNQEWTNGHTCRNVHTCFAEWHAMFHPHQLFTPTVSNFIGRPLTQHMETHGDQHLLFPCSKNYRFRKVPICATFFSIDRADSWCHVRPFPPRPPDFPWQRIPIAMVPSIGSSGNGRKINEVIICWAYVPLRLSLKPLLVGGLEHVLFHIYIYWE